MALADFVPTIWSARFTDKLYANRVWGSLTNRNYEGELSSGGNTVKIPTSSTTISVGDYVSGTAITAAPDKANGDTQDLVVDQQKFFRFIVDDIQEFQTRPDLMDDAMRESAEQVAIVQDTYLRGIYASGHNSSRNTAVSADLTAATAGKDVISAFIDTKAEMTLASIPMENRWAVVNPRTISVIEKYFLTNPADGVYVPAASDGVLRNGFAGTLLGFRLLVTSRTPEVDISSTKYDRLICGSGNGNVTMADQIRELETTRPEDMFADMVKGLYVYGAKLVHDDRLWTIDHKQA